jgi:hypothetical protein
MGAQSKHIRHNGKNNSTVVLEKIRPVNLWGPKLKSIRINRQKGGPKYKIYFYAFCDRSPHPQGMIVP